ncbi:MAG: cytochrome c, partial [Bacteroidota bacterium]
MKTILLSSLLGLLGLNMLQAQPTFSEDIAPIIYNNCTSCHRSGEIGPFPLTNYNEVASWASMIQYVTEIGYMPPWKPDREYSSFVGESGLNEQEIQLIADWVNAGSPQGDPSLEPP